jgi:SAM-dependent methyltransferase
VHNPVRRVAYSAYRRTRSVIRRLLARARSGSLPADLDSWEPGSPELWESVYSATRHSVSEIRSEEARAIADLSAAGDTLLEAGCGSGVISAELATAGRHIVLFDFSKKILAQAGHLFARSNLGSPQLTCWDLSSIPWPLPPGAVDIVWSSGVLEHWTDDQLVPIVSEMARVSRKRVIALVPSSRSLLYMLGKAVAEATGDWQYGWELPRESLAAVFCRAGLVNIREWDLGVNQAAHFLKYLRTPRLRIALDWWEALPANSPLLSGQGYLLLTVGERPSALEGWLPTLGDPVSGEGRS